MKYLLALLTIILFSATVPVIADTPSGVSNTDGMTAVNAFLPSENEEEISFYVAEK